MIIVTKLIQTIVCRRMSTCKLFFFKEPLEFYGLLLHDDLDIECQTPKLNLTLSLVMCTSSSAW